MPTWRPSIRSKGDLKIPSSLSRRGTRGGVLAMMREREGERGREREREKEREREERERERERQRESASYTTSQQQPTHRHTLQHTTTHYNDTQ